MFVERLRTSAHRHPLAFVALSVALSVLIVAIAALAIPEPTIAPGGPAARLYQWGLVLLNCLYIGGMASWGLGRQARKKAWGVPLPDERAVWLFRPCVWAGLAVGLTAQAGWFALWAMAWMTTHAPWALFLVNLSGLLGTLYALRTIGRLYQLPKPRYLIWVAIAPLLVVSVAGILIAIILGQVRRYNEASARAAHPAVTRPSRLRSVPPRFLTKPAHSPASATVVPPTPTAPSGARLADTHCLGGQPLPLPYRSVWSRTGTIVAFVPRWRAHVMWEIAQHAVHGWLEPRYRTNRRVVIHPAESAPGARLLAIVPAGWSVRIGQRVTVVGAHRSHHSVCQYVPNLLVPTMPVPRAR